jgi:hypothetical protein
VFERWEGKEALSVASLRMLRALQVLEQIGSPAARQVVEALGGKAGEGRLRLEAQATLERLATRPTRTP